jgi:hypothetical protein
MAAEPTTRFYKEAFEQALRDRDAAALAAFYRDDAELTHIDRRHPPANPAFLRGREAIRAYLADVLARDVEHRIERIVDTDDALAYSLLCTYPDGLRVRYHGMAELRDGLLHRETGVSAWDETPTAGGHVPAHHAQAPPGHVRRLAGAWYDPERDGTNGIADRAYILRSVDDPDEVIAFGFFDDTDLLALREDPACASARRSEPRGCVRSSPRSARTASTRSSSASNGAAVTGTWLYQAVRDRASVPPIGRTVVSSTPRPDHRPSSVATVRPASAPRDARSSPSRIPPPPATPNSNPRKRSSPTTHASWPGSMTYASLGPISTSVPSSCLIASRPWSTRARSLR